MKKLLLTIFILALVLCFTIPAFAIKILPYNVPLQDLMRWDKYGLTLKLSNPEGETMNIAWPANVDLWNYDGSTWTFNLPSGDTFVFGKGVLVGGTLELVNNSITVTKASGIGVHSVVTPVVAYTGWALGFFGQALISNTTGNAANAAGGVFEVNVTATHTGGKTGIWTGIYAGAFANSTTGGSLPTAGIVVENIAGATVDMSTVPLITFMTCGGGGAGGAMSQILFEIGNAEAAKTVGTLTTEMFYHQTLKCVVNATDYFIPMSTVEGTYTTLYPIDVTVAGATAIDIGTSATGIEFTGTCATAGIDLGANVIQFYDNAVISKLSSSPVVAESNTD